MRAQHLKKGQVWDTGYYYLFIYYYLFETDYKTSLSRVESLSEAINPCPKVGLSLNAKL